MKTIRNLATVMGLSLVVFALGATGAKAQNLEPALLHGSFTLPFEAHWGAMTLPAGEYNLYFGQLGAGGSYLVEVAGKEKGSPHGFIPIQSHDPMRTGRSSLICQRQGRTGIVESLQMPALGEKLFFAIPKGSRLVADEVNGHHTNTLLAEAPKFSQRILVTISAK